METEITDIGKVAITPQKDYQNERTYEWLDVVTYDGAGYMCIAEDGCTGIVPTNTDYWQLLADKGHFTEEDKEEFKKAVVEDSKTEINEHTDTKKTELDNYTIEQEKSLKTELDTYTNTKKTELDTKETELETEMSNKKDELVKKIEDAQSGFDTNVATKTKKFDDNVTAKINDFDTNAQEKTTEYDNNATAKLEEYNNNSKAKIEEFNAKAESYNNRITELETEVDELSENMPWNTTDIAESIHIEDSAKYSRNKLNVFGNLKQETRSGRNFFNVEDSSFSWNTLTVAIVNNILKVEIGDGIGGIGSGTQGKYTEYNFDTSKKYFFSLFRKKGDLEFLESTNNKWLRFYIYIKYEDDSISSTFVEITNKMTQKSKEIIFTEGKKPVSYAIGRYSPSNTLKNNQTAEYYIQLEEDTATEFEEYGAMPSIEYPSMPVVATGVQKIRKCGKNCYDISKFNSTVAKGSFIGHYIYLKPNTEYTISTNMVTDADSLNAHIGSPVNQNAYIVVTTDVNIKTIDSTYGVATMTYKTKTIKTGDTGVLFVGRRNGVTSLTSLINSGGYIQVEEGDTATPYEPYTGQDYTLDLGTTELCKITDSSGNVVAQDKFTFKDSKWQIERNVGKMILNEKNTWQKGSSSNDEYTLFQRTDTTNEELTNQKIAVCDKFRLKDNLDISSDKLKFESIYYNVYTSYRARISIKNSRLTDTTIEAFKSWLKDNNITNYYVRKTPTYEDCTEAQAEVLDKLHKLQLAQGTNNIFVESENGVTAEMQLEYMQNNNLLREKEHAELNNRITAIEEMLSTTETSAMLLDNLQNDLESEVK